jgi:hypothetical protein
VIIDEIAKHEIDWKEPDNYWFCNFFRAIDNVHKLDIFSLNYDTWIEQIFKDKYYDGYVPFDEEYSRFSPENLFNNQSENVLLFIYMGKFVLQPTTLQYGQDIYGKINTNYLKPEISTLFKNKVFILRMVDLCERHNQENPLTASYYHRT